jgi:hypothetical protein
MGINGDPTEKEVAKFRRFIRDILKQLGENPNIITSYRGILDDLLQLYSFNAMIPIKNLGKYIKARTNPEGHEHRLKKKEGAVLDKIAKLVSTKSNFRFLFDDEEWWQNEY